jgi:hypothetical protein
MSVGPIILFVVAVGACIVGALLIAAIIKGSKI